MKRIFLVMLLLVGSLSLVAADADARRFGGRSSIGKQSPNVSRQAQPATAPNQANQAQKAGAPNAAASAAKPKPSMPWKGIVGGLIGGALLAGLFSSLGLGGALSSMLGSILTFAIIGGILFFLFRFFTRKNNATRPAPMNSTFQPAYSGASSGSVNSLPEIGSGISPMSKSFQSADLSATPSGSSFSNAANMTSIGNDINNGNWEIPADFDVNAFLRHAKMNFIRMQAAWDKADLVDIREFTSPEMYAEIKMQLQDRGAETNLTDVVTIDAELLGIETQSNDYLASIKFTGMIKEDINAPAEAFAEVWNLAKPMNGQAGWLVVGIQQL